MFAASSASSASSSSSSAQPTNPNSTPPNPFFLPYKELSHNAVEINLSSLDFQDKEDIAFTKNKKDRVIR